MVAGGYENDGGGDEKYWALLEKRVLFNGFYRICQVFEDQLIDGNSLKIEFRVFCAFRMIL